MPLTAEQQLVVETEGVGYNTVGAKPLTQPDAHNIQCVLGV